MNSADMRQQMGCGFEPPLDPDSMQPLWLPKGFKIADERFPTVCPGYSVHLPEVIEVARARTHWEKGELKTFCAGQPSESMLICIEIMNGSASDLSNAQVTPEKEGGLAK